MSEVRADILLDGVPAMATFSTVGFEYTSQNQIATHYISYDDISQNFLHSKTGAKTVKIQFTLPNNNNQKLSITIKAQINEDGSKDETETATAAVKSRVIDLLRASKLLVGGVTQVEIAGYTETGGITYYAILATIVDHGHKKEYKTAHRYSSFVALRQSLMNLHPDVERYEFPPKVMSLTHDSCLQQERAKALAVWLKNMASTYKTDQHLQDFLRDPHSETLAQSVKDKSISFFTGMVSGTTDLYSRWAYGSSPQPNNNANMPKTNSIVTHEKSKSLPNLPNLEPVSANANRDFHSLLELTNKANLQPKSLPFPKNTLLLMGSTSSGKSAFANYLMGITVKKSVVAQQDDGYTLIEVVSEEEFESWAMKIQNVHNKAPLPDDFDLQSPIVDSTEKVDPRYGIVFLTLSPSNTRLRHQALRMIGESHFKIETVLVNEKYVKNTPNYELAKELLIIDTAGTFSSEKADYTQMKNSLKTMQYFYCMCDKLLYFISGTNVQSARVDLYLLEIIIHYSSQNAEEAVSKIESDLNVNQNGNENQGFMASGWKLLKSIFKRKVNYATDEKMKNSCWEKTLFVLSKLDQVKKESPLPLEEEMKDIYFAIGHLFGANVKRFDMPKYHYFYEIGLPQFQRQLDPKLVYTGKLNKLVQVLKAHADELPYAEKLDTAILELCDQIDSHRKKNQPEGVVSTTLDYLFGNSNQVETIRQGAIARRKGIPKK